MKIGVNLIQYTDIQGIEVFARNLLAELVRRDDNNEFIFFVNQKSAKIFSLNSDRVKVIVNNFNKLSRLNLIFYQQLFMPMLLKREKIDLLFCPSVAAPIFYKKKIVTIHDCAAQHFSKEASLFSRIYLKLAFLSAKKFSLGVATVSEFSKSEIKMFLKIPDDKIKIISEGAPELTSISDSEISDCANKFNLKGKKFFFFISNLRPRKNIDGLMRAWKIFSRKYPNYNLVVAGKNYNYESKGDGIYFLGVISEKEKSSLYKMSEAFIFPSLYEGFGLPILEAQYSRTPVICSNTSSLPEIAGSGALYFNPLDHNSIVESMERFIDPSFNRQELVDKGAVNLKRFSWVNSASSLLSFINSLKSNL